MSMLCHKTTLQTDTDKPCSFWWWSPSVERCQRARRFGSHDRYFCCDKVRRCLPQTLDMLTVLGQHWPIPSPTNRQTSTTSAF